MAYPLICLLTALVIATSAHFAIMEDFPDPGPPRRRNGTSLSTPSM